MPVSRAAQVSQAIRHGRLIQAGVLNDAHAVVLDAQLVFVRERTIKAAADYGQTFAGERYIPDGVRQKVLIPELIEVVDDASGCERYAIFTYIDGGEPSWSGTELKRLARQLADIHEHGADGMGYVGPTLPPPTDDVDGVLLDLLDVELDRMVAAEPEKVGLVERVRRGRTLLPRHGPADICLCHGDVRSANTRVDRDGRLWILDWEAARYRVAASDFNQIAYRWLNPEQVVTLLGAYAERTGRDLGALTGEVDFFRLLWHVRTYNFESLILGRPLDLLDHHIEILAGILSSHDL